MKKIHKISIVILTIGWFPYMWLCAFAVNSSTETIMMVLGIGLILCFTGGILSSGISGKYYNSIEELEKLKEDHRESIRLYNEAKEKLIKKYLDEN